MKKQNLWAGDGKKFFSIILLLCPLVSACAKSAQNDANTLENQNNLTEIEHRIASLENRVAHIDSSVQESSSRVYDVRNKAGKATGWTAHPKQGVKSTAPVAHVSPISDYKNVPSPVMPVGQVAPMPNAQAPMQNTLPASSPVSTNTGPVMSSAVTPVSSPGVTIQSSDSTSARAPMGSLDPNTRMGTSPTPNPSPVPLLPPESAMYPPTQGSTAQNAAMPMQSPVAIPIVPVSNTQVSQNVPQAAPTAPPQKAMSGEQSTYKAALDLVLAGNYAQGRDKFNAFLQQYPNGRLTPNAHYWIGESFYAQKNYPEALLSFKQVTTAYPKHHKTADALLKAGMTYEKLGDTENASLQYRAVVNDFPSSNAAKIARSKNI